MPFSGPSGVGDARIRLQQVDAKLFELLEAFRYSRPSGAVFDVTPEILGKTDLTSVPAGFRWFVNSYGRHTLPALLHDCLIDTERAQRATQPLAGVVAAPTRAVADDIFLETLQLQQVPRIRRYLMWAAVTFATRFLYSGWLVRTGMIVWTLAALVGTLLVYSTVSWPDWTRVEIADWSRLAVGILAPMPFAVTWGRSWFAGICFGYGIVFLVPATIVVHVSFALYWVVEKILQLLGLSTAPPDIDKF